MKFLSQNKSLLYIINDRGKDSDRDFRLESISEIYEVWHREENKDAAAEFFFQYFLQRIKANACDFACKMCLQSPRLDSPPSELVLYKNYYI